VTGASGNLGQAVVKKLLSEGFKVTGTVIPNDPVPLTIKDPGFETVVVDLMNEEAGTKFVETVAAKYGQIDAAVLTVGGFAMGKVTETKTSDLLKQYRLNVETAYNVAQPLFKQMLQQNRGRIFLIGSRPGSDMKYAKGMVAYALAKSMLFRLAE